MKTILVIDDEAGVRECLEVILSLQGFNTITAENGLVGLQLVKEQIPDLIICDLMMPEMDGYKVLRSLREDPTTTSIPFIFVTADDDWTHRCQGIELGANDYLPKPFMPTELLKIISTYLAD
jgi:DNA-binding response OmpR family regulator